jgi:hypothetical protein
MSTGATVSLILILTIAVLLHAIAIYSLYGLFTDRGMKGRKR